MASLQVKGPDFSVTKQKAFDDAKKMQKVVAEQCAKSGKDAPQYRLSELIGKGSFGRVYKATSLTTNQLVAVKIIDIEESDAASGQLQLSDTYGDLLKEINALKLLSETGAKNVNHVIEALPVGQSMWMITEYCAGGSVSTLMRPTSGLQEKWIVPILREVAEAIFWVHKQGIIHRDIKCANVLVTESGDVQLCDFGVAGIIETKFDKRSTVIGTPHWMAPELFDSFTSYGTEVDIWAFGCMVYEIASGLPPNVSAGMDFGRLASNLKHHAPRLEGDQFSAGLKDLVAYCLVADPKKRPLISQVQLHGYIHNTQDVYPTSSLAHLVRGYKLWEAQGGVRKSLFSAGGAQGPIDSFPQALANDEWNFSTTAAFDQQVFNNGDAQAVFDVYGSNIDFEGGFEETTRPQKPKGGGRRRPPPQLPSIKAPLEKIFDPNTISNYEDNSRAYYGRFPPPASPAPPLSTSTSVASDLPLRDDSSQSPGVRESLIDLDASLHGSDLSEFVDLNTIRAGDSRASTDYDFGDNHYIKPPHSDPENLNNNRRTQDWKFPSMATPASANPEIFRFPFNDDNGPATSRQISHPPTEPIQPSAQFNDLAPPPATTNNRASSGSLIDLDMSFADPVHEYPRPSTSHSDVGSIAGSEFGGANPFELEKHASFYVMPSSVREPSIYVSDDSEYAAAVSDLTLHAQPPRHEPLAEYQQPQPQPQPFQQLQQPISLKTPSETSRPYSLSEFADTDPEFLTPQQPTLPDFTPPAPQTYANDDPPPAPPPPQMEYNRPQPYESFLPPAPAPPAPQVMEGRASSEQIKEELRRMAMNLGDHLSHTNTYLSSLPIRRASIRLEPVSDVA